jgi:hypothetical protein
MLMPSGALGPAAEAQFAFAHAYTVLLIGRSYSSSPRRRAGIASEVAGVTIGGFVVAIGRYHDCFATGLGGA